MAIVKKNLVTKGLSGMIGGTLVFRTVGDNTIVSSAPSPSGPPSDAQKEQRERFQQAVIYAKGSMADPVTKAEYQEAVQGKGQANAYNIAVADFFNAPNIVDVDFTNYKGKVKDTINIKVTDDFKVERVTLAIHNPDGSLVEETEAVQQSSGIDWLFTAKVANADLKGDKITIKAYDMPGNETQKEQVL